MRIRQSGKKYFNSIQYNTFCVYAFYSVMNPDKQSFQIVFTALFNFRSFNSDVLKPDFFLDSIQFNTFCVYAFYSVMNPDKQSFQIVFTALFNFRSFNSDVLKPDFFLFYKSVQIESK